MNFMRGRLMSGAVHIGSAQLPLDGYRFRSPPSDGQEVVLGIRPEHVVLAPEGPIASQTLFMEPMGADTLGWFQFGEHRLSARLVSQVRGGCPALSGWRCSSIICRCSIHPPRQGCSALCT
jgi:hypothetical protein